MARYISKPLPAPPAQARPKLWWHEPWYSDDDESPIVVPSITVYDDREAEFIGIYDEDGDPIYRLPEPIGFFPLGEIDEDSEIDV